VDDQIFKVHIRSLEREQFTHTKTRESIQNDRRFARLPEMFEQRLDLVDIQPNSSPLTIGALTRLRDGVPFVSFPADRVIEDRVQKVPYLRFAAVG
jgi:hypothetical protein